MPSYAIKIIVVRKEVVYRPTSGKESLHEVSNDNGLQIVNFVIVKNLIVASIYFPWKNIYKHTWISMDGKTKNQIDFALIEKNLSSKIM